eukprot:Lankesteria_metandrocarpae@DN4065_c0_g1_i2.p1
MMSALGVGMLIRSVMNRMNPKTKIERVVRDDSHFIKIATHFPFGKVKEADIPTNGGSFEQEVQHGLPELISMPVDFYRSACPTKARCTTFAVCLIKTQKARRLKVRLCFSSGPSSTQRPIKRSFATDGLPNNQQRQLNTIRF